MNFVNSQTFFNFLSFSKVYCLKKNPKIEKNVQKLAGLTLKVTWQLCLRLAQYFIRGSCIFTVLAQFAHFSKSCKKRKHCANAISLQKNTPKAKLQLLTDLLDELCQFSYIFPFFAIFQSVYIALRKIQPPLETPLSSR